MNKQPQFIDKIYHAAVCKRVNPIARPFAILLAALLAASCAGPLDQSSQGTLLIALPGGGYSRTAQDDFVASLTFTLRGTGPGPDFSRDLNPGLNPLQLALGTWDLVLTVSQGGEALQTIPKQVTLRQGRTESVQFEVALKLPADENPDDENPDDTDPPQQGVVFTTYWLSEQGEISLTGSGAIGNSIALSVGDTLAISPSGSGSSGHRWFVNQAEDASQTGPSYTFVGKDKEPGKTYTVTLLVEMGGKYYTAHFMVTMR